MITDDLSIKYWPLPAGKSATQEALENYAETSPDTPLIYDLADYACHGVVIIRQDVFGLARLIDWHGQPAWFIRMAVGDLLQLATFLRDYVLPSGEKSHWIAFCRRKEGKVRVYPVKRLINLAHKLKGT